MIEERSTYNNSPASPGESPMIFERNVEDPCLLNSTSTISRQASNTSLFNPRKYSASNTGLNLHYTHSASSQKPHETPRQDEDEGLSAISHSSTNLSVDGGAVEQEVIYQNPINHRRTLENFVPPALDEGCSIVTDDATDLDDVDMVFVHSRKPSTIGLDMALGRTRSMSTLKPGSITEGLEMTSSANSEHATSPKLIRFYSYADMLSEDNCGANNQYPKRPSFSHHSHSSNLLQKSKTTGPSSTTAMNASNFIASSPPKNTAATQGFVNPFIVSRRYSSNTGPIQTVSVSPPGAALPAGSRSQSNLLRQGSYSALSPNNTPLSCSNSTSAGNCGNNNNNNNNNGAVKPDRFMRANQRPTIFRNYSAGGGLNEVGSPTSPTLSLSTSPRVSSNNRSLTSPPPLTSSILIKSGRSNSSNVTSPSTSKSQQIRHSPQDGAYHLKTPDGRRQVSNVNKTLTKFHIESSGSEDYSTDEDYDGDNDYGPRGDSKKNSVDSNVIDDDDSEDDGIPQHNEHRDEDKSIDPLVEGSGPNGNSFFSPHIKIPKNKIQKNLMSSFEKFQHSKIWRGNDRNKSNTDTTSSNNANETPITSKSNSFSLPSTNSNSSSTITATAEMLEEGNSTKASTSSDALPES